MTSDGKSNGAAPEESITRLEVPTLIITLDPRTHMVNLSCEGVAISVAQMMLDEVARKLDIQRRQAAAMELQKSLGEARRTAAIVDSLTRKG